MQVHDVVARPISADSQTATLCLESAHLDKHVVVSGWNARECRAAIAVRLERSAEFRVSTICGVHHERRNETNLRTWNSILCMWSPLVVVFASPNEDPHCAVRARAGALLQTRNPAKDRQKRRVEEAFSISPGRARMG